MMDIAMDEGSLREKKLKKLHQLQQRKMQEEQRRKHLQRDKSADRQLQRKQINQHHKPNEVNYQIKVKEQNQQEKGQLPINLKKSKQTPINQPTKLPSSTPSTKKQFTKNSNKKIIKNAIQMVCLAGETHKLEREEVLKALEGSDHLQYLILFKGNLGR